MNPRSNPRSAVVDGDVMKCQEAIGYLFRREGLLRKALTHSSVKDDLHPSNERMEFLGDAILGMVISEYLFSILPGNDEGDLTRVKSVVVSGESLARLGFEIGLDKYLFIGKGLRMKGEVPRSLIANVVEAVIAAVYLDRGMEAARHFVLDHLHTYVEEVLKDDHTEKNFKSMLQQRAQKEYSSTPVYRVLQERGPDHSKLFRVSAVVKNREFTPGKGASKKEAEQDAARTALDTLEQEGKSRGKRGGGRRNDRPEQPERRPEPSRRSGRRAEREPEQQERRRPERKPERKTAAPRDSRPPREPKVEEAPAPRRRRPSKKAAAQSSENGRGDRPARAERSEDTPAPAPRKRAAKKPAAKKKASARRTTEADPEERKAPARKSRARKPRAKSEERETSEGSARTRRAPSRTNDRAENSEQSTEAVEKRKPRRRRSRPSNGSR